MSYVLPYFGEPSEARLFAAYYCSTSLAHPQVVGNISKLVLNQFLWQKVDISQSGKSHYRHPLQTSQSCKIEFRSGQTQQSLDLLFVVLFQESVNAKIMIHLEIVIFRFVLCCMSATQILCTTRITVVEGVGCGVSNEIQTVRGFIPDLKPCTLVGGFAKLQKGTSQCPCFTFFQFCHWRAVTCGRKLVSVEKRGPVLLPDLSL